MRGPPVDVRRVHPEDSRRWVEKERENQKRNGALPRVVVFDGYLKNPWRGIQEA
jgi:hypothetical protein